MRAMWLQLLAAFGVGRVAASAAAPWVAANAPTVPTGLFGSAADRVPPRYTVDLDADPAHRWDAIARVEGPRFRKTMKDILSDLGLAGLLDIAEKVLGQERVARRLFPGDLFLEAKGAARAVGIEFAEFVLGSSFYDLFAAKVSPRSRHACSGVIAQTAGGGIVHGRNLDYIGKLRDIVLVVDFVRGGSVVFTAVTLGPSPFFDTAVRWGAYSVTQNERNTGTIFENVYDMLFRGRPALFASFRQALETTATYDSAVDFFEQVPLNAAAYFIVGGTRPGEGAVITRDRSEVADIWRLDATAGRWYVLETNYDRTDPPKSGDDRRHPLMRALDATGQRGMDPRAMWDVISITDVNRSAGERSPLNNETVYSTVMQASDPTSFKTLVRARHEPPPLVFV